MPKVANPFIYGGPVNTQHFFGRSNEINLVFDRVKSHARESVAIIGERRIGKTSLLHYVSASDVLKRWDLEEEQSIFIFQDCGSISPLSITNFWKTVLKHAVRLLKKKRIAVELQEIIQELLNGDEITTLDIEFLLEDVHESGLIVVLILDEFEELVRTDPENEATTRNFLAGLRALINHRSRVLSLIVATRQPLNEICQDIRFMGSPFYNNFVFVHLRPFNKEEAELLLDQMLSNTTITFSKAEKDYIYDLAGTHPLLLQAAAAIIFDLKLGGAKEIRDLSPIREQFLPLVEHQFEDFWRWSQPREREILMLLARGDHDRAMTCLSEWADERERLLRRGLILKDRDDSYALFSSAFLRWLIDNLYRLQERHPPTSPQINHLKQQLAAHHQRLNKLKEIAAVRGADTPPHLLIEIEDIEAKIVELEREIAEG